MKWQRVGSGYDIVYQGMVGGRVTATIYRGGDRWYPWSWRLVFGPDHRNHGTATTLFSAKEKAQARLSAIWEEK